VRVRACLTRVRPPVSLQLVAPREPLAAEHPVADEGPLARVPAQVGPQVGRLAVHLGAARDVANVLLLLAHARASAAQTGGSERERARDGETDMLLQSTSYRTHQTLLILLHYNTDATPKTLRHHYK